MAIALFVTIVGGVIAGVILMCIPIETCNIGDAVYEISSPLMDDDIAEDKVVFSGTSSDHNESCYLWLVITTNDSSGWWPQVSQIEPSKDGYWEGTVYFNAQYENKRYRVCLIATTKEGNDGILSYLEASSKKDDYPAMELPDKHEKLCEAYINFR